MSAEPTIVATSTGFVRGRRVMRAFSPVVHHAVDLSGATGTPKVTYVGTALGDWPDTAAHISAAGRDAGFDVRHLALFPMPNVDDLEELVMTSDLVWVGGGSVANLLALWRLHGLDSVFEKAWNAGVVLAGVSAGSICWHKGGTTDSFGPDLDPITNGLGFLPFDNGVHYDNEARRRPLVHELVADGTLGTTYCTDDGVGLVYHGTTLTEAITDIEGKGAYVVRAEDGRAIEERIEPRFLAGPKHR
ncbi:Type 1 glutamine amidotransferase-like domain-containing protein [Humidisolicoccus flavus]|uniref:Type 1 glutamine amidotransferase-like domain-containing protein n=1 Tax=Humidisolicoccus flavus TaxID=3111414 RepID=UPI00324B1581